MNYINKSNFSEVSNELVEWQDHPHFGLLLTDNRGMILDYLKDSLRGFTDRMAMSLEKGLCRYGASVDVLIDRCDLPAGITSNKLIIIIYECALATLRSQRYFPFQPESALRSMKTRSKDSALAPVSYINVVQTVESTTLANSPNLANLNARNNIFKQIREAYYSLDLITKSDYINSLVINYSAEMNKAESAVKIEVVNTINYGPRKEGSEFIDVPEKENYKNLFMEQNFNYLLPFVFDFTEDESSYMDPYDRNYAHQPIESGPDYEIYEVEFKGSIAFVDKSYAMTPQNLFSDLRAIEVCNNFPHDSIGTNKLSTAELISTIQKIDFLPPRYLIENCRTLQFKPNYSMCVDMPAPFVKSDDSWLVEVFNSRGSTNPEWTSIDKEESILLSYLNFFNIYNFDNQMEGTTSLTGLYAQFIAKRNMNNNNLAVFCQIGNIEDVKLALSKIKGTVLRNDGILTENPALYKGMRALYQHIYKAYNLHNLTFKDMALFMNLLYHKTDIK